MLLNRAYVIGCSESGQRLLTVWPDLIFSIDILQFLMIGRRREVLVRRLVFLEPVIHDMLQKKSIPSHDSIFHVLFRDLFNSVIHKRERLDLTKWFDLNLLGMVFVDF